MAMGKRPAARQASPMWVDTADLPTNDGHPYFERLNRVLADSGFDAFVEELCAAFYADRLGRPSLRPGRYFRMLFIGYFEGLSSERGIAWRVADSLSLRSFLDLELTEAAPDHSTLSRTRRRIESGSRRTAAPRRGFDEHETVILRRALPLRVGKRLPLDHSAIALLDLVYAALECVDVPQGTLIILLALADVGEEKHRVVPCVDSRNTVESIFGRGIHGHVV